MAFWNKNKELKIKQDICAVIETDPWYADRVERLAKSKGYEFEMLEVKDGAAKFRVYLPSDKLDKALDLCDSPLGKKFM